MSLVNILSMDRSSQESPDFSHGECQAGIAQRKSNCLVSSGLVGSNPLAGSIGMVLRGGIDMTIDPEELLEDLDFMVETVRKNCGIVSFLSVAHSAREIRQILKSSIQEKDTK